MSKIYYWIFFEYAKRLPFYIIYHFRFSVELLLVHIHSAERENTHIQKVLLACGDGDMYQIDINDIENNI